MSDMTTNNSGNDSIDLDKIDKDITKHRLRAFLIIILIVVLYLFLADKPLSESAQSWGTFGDFIGGILNPIFALFAFYWLTYSVRLQIKELKDTRAELQKAANAQVETAIHQENIAELEKQNVETQKNILELQGKSLITQIKANESQQNQTSIQNFENLFFQLLKTKNDALDDIEYKKNNQNNDPTDITILKSVDAIKQHIIDFKDNPRRDWLNYYEENMLDYTGSYFRICYQIVKLIDSNKTLVASIENEKDKSNIYSAEQKKYFDIFRATLTKHEIEAFFFNCLNEYGNKKFKKLIEKYGLFEPLPIDHNRKNEVNHRLTRYAYQYNSIIFEENNYWKDYYNELKKINLNIDINIMKEILEKLRCLNIIADVPVHLLSHHKRPLEGFEHKFDRSIDLEDLSTIFSGEKLLRLQSNESFREIKSNIQEEKDHLLKVKDRINTITWCLKNDTNEKKYTLNQLNNMKANLHNLNNMEKVTNNKIYKLEKDIKELEEKINSLKNSEYTPTVLILIKYGISFTEYKKYMESKQVADDCIH